MYHDLFMDISWWHLTDMFATFHADDPSNDPNVSGDPYKTLFIAKLVSHSFFVSFLKKKIMHNLSFLIAL